MIRYIIEGEIDAEDIMFIVGVALALIAIVFIISKVFSWNFYTCFCIIMFIISVFEDLFIE